MRAASSGFRSRGAQDKGFEHATGYALIPCMADHSTLDKWTVTRFAMQLHIPRAIGALFMHLPNCDQSATSP